MLFFSVLIFRLQSVTFQKEDRKFIPNFKKIETSANNFLEKEIFKTFPQPQAGLLAGILIGAKVQISENLFAQMRATGVLHLIALSGANISFLITVLFGLNKIVGRKAGSVFSIIFIILFIQFVGPSPSVVRAGIMGVMLIVSQILGQKYEEWYALIFTAYLMLIIHPVLISDLSFQLSVLATIGVLISPKSGQANNQSIVKIIFEYIKVTFVLSLYTQFLTAPLIFYNFQTFSMVSIFTNIAVSWLVNHIMTLGFVSVLFSLLIGNFCLFLNTNCSFFETAPSVIVLPFLDLFLWIIQLFAKIPVASLVVPVNLSSYLLIIYYGFFTIIWSIWRLARK